jgi:Flp pilus assembly protein TadG
MSAIMLARLIPQFVAVLRRVEAVAADRRGVAAVQFALIATPLLLFLLGIEETSRLMWTQAAINMAVEDAARDSSVKSAGGVCAANDAAGISIAQYAASRAWGLSVPSGDFTLSTPVCGCKVAASVPFTPIVPKLVPYNITLTANACFPPWS